MNNARAPAKMWGLDEEPPAHQRAGMAGPIELRGQHGKELGFVEYAVEGLLFGHVREPNAICQNRVLAVLHFDVFFECFPHRRLS